MTMPKFIVKDTQACWVTWSHVIEADTAEQARTKYVVQQPTSNTAPEIGDTLDDYHADITIEPE